MEEDLHGPGIDAKGVAFPGVNLYVQLGHGRDYAWSATSAGQDIIDTFAVPVCDATHYRFRGQCLPIEVLERKNAWTPNLADQTPPGAETLHAERTKLGLVVGRGTYKGKKVLYTVLRSTYQHEVDSAVGFSLFNEPGTIRSPQDFERRVAIRRRGTRTGECGGRNQPSGGLVRLARVHRARIDRALAGRDLVDDEVAGPREQAEDVVLVGLVGRPAVVGRERGLVVPGVYDDELVGAVERLGDVVGAAAGLGTRRGGGPAQELHEFRVGHGDPMHAGDGDHGHLAQSSTPGCQGAWPQRVYDD
jgi:hypothetical protein